MSIVVVNPASRARPSAPEQAIVDAWRWGHLTTTQASAKLGSDRAAKLLR